MHTLIFFAAASVNLCLGSDDSVNPLNVHTDVAVHRCEGTTCMKVDDRSKSRPSLSGLSDQFLTGQDSAKLALLCELQNKIPVIHHIQITEAKLGLLPSVGHSERSNSAETADALVPRAARQRL